MHSSQIRSDCSVKHIPESFTLSVAPRLGFRSESVESELCCFYSSQSDEIVGTEVHNHNCAVLYSSQ